MRLKFIRPYLPALVYAGLAWPSLTSASCDGLLLNAEASGFGATTAIAQIKPLLKDANVRLGFIGAGQAFARQASLKYADLVELANDAGDDEIFRRLQDLRPAYSHFFTVRDFRYAQLAHAAGFKVGLFDPSYSLEAPKPERLANLDLYVVQNFAGVSAAVIADLARQPSPLPDLTWIVAPVLPASTGESIHRRASHALVNVDDSLEAAAPADLIRDYAALLIRLSGEAIADQVRKRDVVTASERLAALPGSERSTPIKINDRLGRVRIAVMTPGFERILAAAAAGTPVVWLPPTTAAQDKVLRRLDHLGLVDARVDWDELLDSPADGAPADNFEANVRLLLASPELQDRLREQLSNKVRTVLNLRSNLKLRKLVHRFGSTGVPDLAEMIRIWHRP